MFDDQYQEHLSQSAPCASRWDGFDRGDTSQNGDDDLTLANNEELLAELRAKNLI